MKTRWQCMICGYIAQGDAAPAQCPSCGAPFTAFSRMDSQGHVRLDAVRISSPRPAGYRYVIIGNSAAGRAAARTIRALHPEGLITLISQESVPLYARPLLPDLIAGMDKEAFFASGASFDNEGIVFHRGVTAQRVLLPAREVQLEHGETIPFDVLLLATGSAPIQIPLPGAEVDGIAYFRSYDDAQRIAALLRDARDTVVVGGGLLGLEFVRAFLAAGKQVTMLVRDAQIGAPALDEAAGALLRTALDHLGVQVVTGDEVAQIIGRDGRVAAVQTKGGLTLPCQLVGVAVGVRPRIELAQTAELAVDRGILVNRQFQTSYPVIYAAGDVALAHDRLWQEPRITTSWRNALQQGELAGIAMAGGDVDYPGACAINYQLAAGLPFCTLGIANPPAEGFQAEVQANPEAQTYRKTVMRDGTLVGAVFIGDLSDAATIEGQLQGSSTVQTTPEQPVILPTEPLQRRSTMHRMTEDNVQAAFAGESQAHMKYLNFAEKAEQEGNSNVARLFRAASYAEQAHASAHLEVLHGVASTAENLDAAIAGEGFEIAEMYPAYLAVAVEQEEDEAQESLNYALQVEKQHLTLYTRAKAAVTSGSDVTLDDIWVCNYCGCTVEGEPPAKCPICGNPRKNFVKF